MNDSNLHGDIPLQSFDSRRNSSLEVDGSGGCIPSHQSSPLQPQFYRRPPAHQPYQYIPSQDQLQHSNSHNQTSVTYAVSDPMMATRQRESHPVAGHTQTGFPPGNRFTNLVSSTRPYGYNPNGTVKQFIPGPIPMGQAESEQSTRLSGSRGGMKFKQVVMKDIPDRPADIVEVNRRGRPVTSGEHTETGEEMVKCINQMRERLKSKVLQTLDTEKIDLGRDILEHDTEELYRLLDYNALLNANKTKDRLPLLINALAILEKYCINLVKQPRPPLWRTIKLNNSVFVSQVKCIRGWKPVLHLMGYTDELDNAMAFPSNVTEPDVEKVKILSVDLYIAHSAVDALVYEQHPYLIVDPPVQTPPAWPSSSIPYIPREPENTSSSTEDIPSDALDCTVCGDPPGIYKCDECGGNICCKSCDEIWHSHPQRRSHKRVNITLKPDSTFPFASYVTASDLSSVERTAVPKPPVPAPRHKKPTTSIASSVFTSSTGTVRASDTAQVPVALPRPLPPRTQSGPVDSSANEYNTYSGQTPMPPEQLQQFWRVPREHSTSSNAEKTSFSSNEPYNPPNVASASQRSVLEIAYPPSSTTSTPSAKMYPPSPLVYPPSSSTSTPSTMMYPPSTLVYPPTMMHSTQSSSKNYPTVSFTSAKGPGIVPMRNQHAATKEQMQLSNSYGMLQQTDIPFKSTEMYPSMIPSQHEEPSVPPFKVYEFSRLSSQRTSNVPQQRQEQQPPVVLSQHLTQQNEPERVLKVPSQGFPNVPQVKQVQISSTKGSEAPKERAPQPSRPPPMSSCPTCGMLHAPGIIICKNCKTALPEMPEFDVPLNKQQEDKVKSGTDTKEWNCEFCTFLNKPDSKICEICCKSRRQNNEILKPKENVPVSKKPEVILQVGQPPEDPQHLTQQPKIMPHLTQPDVMPRQTKPRTSFQDAQMGQKSKGPLNNGSGPQYTVPWNSAEDIKPRKEMPDERLMENEYNVTKPTRSGPVPGKPNSNAVSGSNISSSHGVVQISTAGPSQPPTPSVGAVGGPSVDDQQELTELAKSCIIEAQQQEQALLKEKWEAKRRMLEMDEVQKNKEMSARDNLPENVQFPEIFPIRQSPLPEGLPVEKKVPKQNFFPEPPMPQLSVYTTPDFSVDQTHPSYNLPFKDTPFWTTTYNKSDLGYDSEFNMDERSRNELYVDGMQYVMLLREAEKNGFEAEELNVATYLGYEDPAGPIHWLKTEWSNKIVSVIGMVISEGHDVGNITTAEARESLIECTGDVERAAKKCIKDRENKIESVMKNGVYSRSDCNFALDKHYGDVDAALEELEKLAIEPILKKILNNPITEDDDETQEVVEINHRPDDISDIEDVLANKEIGVDKRIRVILAELGTIQSWGRAETAIKLIDMEYKVSDCIEAARNCGDLARSLRYLQNECPICVETKPMGEMLTFLNCQDAACKDCISQYITTTIKDKSLMHLNCPTCGEPNLDDETVAMEYFNNLDIMMRGLVDDQTHNLFQQKLRDRTLMKEPNFRWCSHCSSGFINERPDTIKMTCPHCNRHTCFKCKKQWEDQHEGISCERFAAWKAANDPELQAAGLAAHLKDNGIECPNCQFRYDLAKGGCMHFKCTQCSHEFCSGCYCPFKHGERCNVSEACAGKGLHAHHPRDCLFYLRDCKIEELQKMLADNDVEFDTEPQQNIANMAAEQEEEDDELQGAVGGENVGYCKVPEQKETGEGLADAECGDQSLPGHAGLCKLHYIEYLVNKVNDNFIDPADIMSAVELTVVLMRGHAVVLARVEGEGEDVYRERLLAAVKEELPLPQLPPRRRILNPEN